MIKILFFGATADIVGSRSIEIAYEAPTTVEDVLERLSGDFPALHIHRLLVAVNQEYVRDNKGVQDGDEVAVFTPVSGG